MRPISRSRAIAAPAAPTSEAKKALVARVLQLQHGQLQAWAPAAAGAQEMPHA